MSLPGDAIRRDLEHCAAVFEETAQPCPFILMPEFASDGDMARCYGGRDPVISAYELTHINTARAAVLHRHGIPSIQRAIDPDQFLRWRTAADRPYDLFGVQDYLGSLPDPVAGIDFAPAKPLFPGFMIGTAAELDHEEDPGWIISRAPLVIARCQYESDHAIRFEIWDVERFAALSEKRQAKIARAMLQAWRHEFDADIEDFAADRPRGWTQPPSLLLESTPSRFTGWLRCAPPMAIFTALEHRPGFTNVHWLDDPLDLRAVVIAEELDSYSLFLEAESDMPPPA